MSQKKINEYCIIGDYKGNGKVYNQERKVLWHFELVYQKKHLNFLYGLFFKFPDFLFCDKAKQKELLIQREQKYLLNRFVMHENGSCICTIQQKSILKNEYTINFNDGSKWVFRKPLFSVYFTATSMTGEVNVRMTRHDTWYLQVVSNYDEWRLIAALAFLQWEHQRS